MTDDSDEDYGRRLGTALREHPPIVGHPDLGDASLRIARGVRQRRRAGATAAAVIAAVVVGTLVTAGLVGSRTAEPVAPTVAMPSPSSSDTPRQVARAVDLRLDRLSTGPADGVEWVDATVWHRADGSTLGVGTILDDTHNAEFFRFGDGLFANQFVVTQGLGGPFREPQQFVVLPGQPLQRLELGTQVFAAGPNRTVVYLTSSGSRGYLHQLGPKGEQLRAQLPVGVADGPVIGGYAFLQSRGGVTRYVLAPPVLTQARPLHGVDLASGHPDGYRVILTDRKGCTAVVPVSEAEPRQWECRFPVTTLSADGRFAYGYDKGRDEGAVFDADGNEVMVLQGGASDQAVFTTDDRLVTLASAASADGTTFSTAVVVCSLPGECHRVSQPATGRIDRGQRPLALVEP